MKRERMRDLVRWATAGGRALLLCGMPGCGKTHLAMQFGKEHFGDVAYFDLGERRTLRAVRRAGGMAEGLLEELSLLRGRGLHSRKTLLILDGLSDVEGRRLVSRLASAGSCPVLGIASHPSLSGAGDGVHTEEKGGVLSLRLYPMTFGEFALAAPPEARREGERTLFRRYLRVGGMPEAVKAYWEEEDLAAANAVHAALSSRILCHLAGGAPPKMFEKLSAVWHSVPLQLEAGRERFRFADVRAEWRAKDLEEAVAWLCRSGLLYRLPRLSGVAPWDGRAFSLIPADVGLLSFLLGGGEEALLERTAVLGEWRARGIDGISSWHSGNMAQVDFLVGDVPVLQKAGRLRARALAEYRKRFHPKEEWILSAEGEEGTVPPWRAAEVFLGDFG